jgi:hypothetical protein
MWILRISCAERSSNRDKILEIFHIDDPGIKRSEINKEGCSLLPGNFGLGLKFGKVGIQEVVHIGKWELIETCRLLQRWGVTCNEEYLSITKKH